MAILRLVREIEIPEGQLANVLRDMQAGIRGYGEYGQLLSTMQHKSWSVRQRVDVVDSNGETMRSDVGRW